MDTTDREIAIRASGAAISVVSGFPEVAALSTVAADVLNRYLSEMERNRVESVANLAAQEISDRMKAGESLRRGWTDGSSTYHEVIENLLLKAQREPEGKKLPYMAHLLANLAFGVEGIEIDVNVSHGLLDKAAYLRYSQLCLLRLSYLVSTEDDHLDLRSVQYRDSDYEPREIDTFRMIHLMSDIRELDFEELIDAGGGAFLLSSTDTIPSSLKLGNMGKILYIMMGLSEIPNSDLTTMKALLRE